MQRTTITILLVGFAALFGAQLSGIHAHIDSHGFEGAVQSALEHHHDDGDDHHGDLDVQVVDLGIGTSKLVFLLFAVTITLFLLALSSGHLTFDRKARLLVSRRLTLASRSARRRARSTPRN
jgi:hypothetical protein